MNEELKRRAEQEAYALARMNHAPAARLIRDLLTELEQRAEQPVAEPRLAHRYDDPNYQPEHLKSELWEKLHDKRVAELVERDREIEDLKRQLAIWSPAAKQPKPEPVAFKCVTEPDAKLIDHCAQRLVSWDGDFCVWPDSWDERDVAAARRDAEKVLRSAYAVGYLVPVNTPPDPAIPDGYAQTCENADRCQALAESVLKDMDVHPAFVNAMAGAPNIDEMVNRFLGWRLPQDFHPDNFINFDAKRHDTWGGYPQSWPVGTNLLTAQQAREMILHLLAAAPKVKS